jgi:uncharacterized membrane protein
MDEPPCAWIYIPWGCISIYFIKPAVFNPGGIYAAPIIMMAQNRQNERDRIQAPDYKTNIEAKKEIEELQLRLNAIESEKPDKMITLLEQIAIKIK